MGGICLIDVIILVLYSYFRFMMPRVKPKSRMTGKGRSALKVVDRKPIRPLERQRMRPWLIELLDRKSCHQLGWFDKAKKTFKVSWKHAAGQTFDPDSDATLFELWARHTGMIMALIISDLF